MLILKKPTSNKLRWKSIYFEPNFNKINKLKIFKIKNISLKEKKKRINTRFLTINTKFLIKLPYQSVIQDYVFNNFYKKEYVTVINIYNQISTLVNSTVYYPGFIYRNSDKNIKNYIGHYITLKFIPINSIISNIYNKTNLKNTYSKAPGSNSVKKKYLKKSKLIYINLPSKTLILLSENTLALFGKTFSNNNKSVAGGFGNNITRLKKVKVRGVAKNPVDHPNGGRTKAKQPELSPWGWVAKFNK